ncbi:MAG: ATP synthase subunit I [Gammaproteobacteria bacterium]|nr:ATP synthase subunit I [Gammaproteobacteria bacterium]
MSVMPRAEFPPVGRGALLVRVAILQLAVTTSCALIALCWGRGAALAALLGGMNALASSVVFGSIALVCARGRSQRAVLTAFFLGEAGKFLAVATGFVLIFHVAGSGLSRGNTLVLFGVFTATLVAQGAVATVRKSAR